MPFPTPFLCHESRTSSHQSFWGSKRLPALILTWTSPSPPLLWARGFSLVRCGLCHSQGQTVPTWWAVPRVPAKRGHSRASCCFKCTVRVQASTFSLLSSPGLISPCTMEVRRCSHLAPTYQRLPCSLDNLSHTRETEIWDKCRLPMWRCHPGLLSASPLILQGGQTFKLPPQSTPFYRPPSPDSLPHFPLKLCLQDVSGQRAGFWSYRLGCAALAGGGAVGRVGFGLLLQASFPPTPLTLGGGQG